MSLAVASTRDSSEDVEEDSDSDFEMGNLVSDDDDDGFFNTSNKESEKDVDIVIEPLFDGGSMTKGVDNRSVIDPLFPKKGKDMKDDDEDIVIDSLFSKEDVEKKEKEEDSDEEIVVDGLFSDEENDDDDDDDDDIVVDDLFSEEEKEDNDDDDDIVVDALFSDEEDKDEEDVVIDSLFSDDEEKTSSDDDLVLDPLFPSSRDADDEEEREANEPETLFPHAPEALPIPVIPMTLRQRRQSKSNPLMMQPFAKQRRASLPRNPSYGKLNEASIRKNASYGKLCELEERRDSIIDNEKFLPNGKRCPRYMWKKAMRMLRRRADPWLEYHIEKYKVYKVKRHRYNALKKAWVTDFCYVKMEPAPFNHGAMRECFRLKKMNAKNCNWLRAHNYVAKRYIQDVDRQIYFEDVVLQMDAKLWGEEFNRHRPPKKVDIFQMTVIEFVDEEGSPLYHLEHFIEGEYIKYNSNSGFVEEHMRNTPQAFSHFTFERSGHEMIVIDIQGVGDLYTDPQIHTADGQGYGDGNLGTRGMALFFHSHHCNTICETLKLAPFDLAESEKQQTETYRKLFDAATKIRGFEEMCISPSPKERIDLSKFMHKRTISCSSQGSNKDSGEGDSHMSDEQNLSEEDENDEEHDDFVEPPIMFRPRRRGNVSESEGDTWSKEDDKRAFSMAMKKNHRSSCIQAELNKLQLKRLSDQFMGKKPDKESESILGQIHLDLAKYHEAGRFTMSEAEMDTEASLFHVEQAAKLGIMEAILTLARLYLDMQRDLIPDMKLDDFPKGLKYMEDACNEGSREAAVLLGQAYQLGNFGLEPDWAQAIHFYEEAMNLVQDEDQGECVSAMDNPNYSIMAAIAQMHAEGGNGIDACPQKAYDMYNEAAELAQTALKGRLAMKYYTLAEEAGAELE